MLTPVTESGDVFWVGLSGATQLTGAALFAVGSGISLGLAPAALRRLQDMGNRLRKDSGTRIAGFLLAATAAWALWMDVAHRVAVWCGLA